MRFYLGTHKPCWLRRTDAPLFVSRRSLATYRTPPRALGKWALDSGGFTELQQFGRWETPARQYVDEVRRWRDAVGGLEWAAIQDWMCEPVVIAGGKVGPVTFKGTGLSVREHQRRTTHSYLYLKSVAPEIQWVPVLQGYRCEEYLEHLDEYNRALPFPLSSFRLVGVGSVCRRQAMGEALDILEALHARGLRLHGFGFKLEGLSMGASVLLASADSMAWSYEARRAAPLPGCPHKSCANCMKYALKWREKAVGAIGSGLRRFEPSLYAKGG